MLESLRFRSALRI